MAKKVRSNARASRSAPRRTRARRPQRRRRLNWSALFAQPEFRQDRAAQPMLKGMRFTRLQRLRLLRWALYIALCVFCLVIQDVIMSRVRIFGASTDLAAGAILLITVLEGSEVGGVFVLLASMVYYFSGSAPGAYTVGLLTVLGILATVFRQQVWHRSVGSIVMCAGLALMLYELGLYGVGIFLGLTRWARLYSFLITSGLTVLAMIPMYYLLFKIGQIGGYTWKE